MILVKRKGYQLSAAIASAGMVRCSKKIFINVSGERYETFEGTLQRYPNTLLGNCTLRVTYYDYRADLFYFNRSRIAFDAILFYYQSNGCLVRPPFISMEMFEHECVFFQLGENAIKRMKEREGYDTQKRILVQEIDTSCRERVWEFFEKPESSLPARIYTFFSMVAIIFAVAMDCFETTLPEVSEDQTELTEDGWEITKLSLNVFFAMEFLFRFLSSPCKWRFIRKLLNIIDLLAVYPYFLKYAINVENVKTILFVRVLRTLRVLRLLRLSKTFRTLLVVLHILAKSVSDLFMLIFCVLISCTVFGSIIFYSEFVSESPNARKSSIVSIPEGMYFAMQTVVSIGYGDIVPISPAGKFTSAITAIVGALTMTVPLLSLGGKYFATYTNTFDVNLSADLITTPGPNVLKNHRENVTKQNSTIK